MERCGSNTDVSLLANINISLLFYMIERVQSFKIYSGFVLKLYLIIGFFVQTFKNLYDIGNVVKLSLRSYICTSTVLSHTIDQVYNYRNDVTQT